VFLLLLCNDRAVLGPRTNPRWLNALATVIVGVLLVLSALLMMATLFPGIDVTTAAIVLGSALAGVLAVLGLRAVRGGPRGDDAAAATPVERRMWTMPPLETLPRPVLGGWRRFGLSVLRVYLVVAVLLLVVKTIELAGAPLAVAPGPGAQAVQRPALAPGSEATSQYPASERIRHPAARNGSASATLGPSPMTT
jgi:hypothetical protein